MTPPHDQPATRPAVRPDAARSDAARPDAGGSPVTRVFLVDDHALFRTGVRRSWTAGWRT